MDDLDERARAVEDYARANAGNNSAQHVADRYVALHAQHGWPVPVRAGVQIEPPPGRLFPKTVRGKHGVNYQIRSAFPAGGIYVRLEDERTGEVAEYQVEINGLNAVEVTVKLR
ncbi:hypothetical protein [Paraburkholderia sp. J7]|uniref:hypothetical protein n=1 Tax=Paraburkholderia sp. J7 TaxID=2805438 RepID=UPI002AB5FDC1|nr:hypothetical protein [Paraburkholderia sp. J7]